MKDDPYISTDEKGGQSIGFVGIEPYVIGRNTYVGEFCHISQHTEIGHFTSIGNLCTIGAHSHALDKLTTFPFIEILKESTYKGTTVGNDVWIGSNSVILAGVTLGHGCVIGAGSVVTKDVPPYAIAFGNPAKVRRYRFDPILISNLLETRWWDMPAAAIKALPFHDPWACVRVLLDKQKIA